MTHCCKECLMPLEIDNLSSFICKMSACQLVSRRQTSKDTAAHMSSLPATKQQVQCGRADSPSPCGIFNHLRAPNSQFSGNVSSGGWYMVDELPFLTAYSRWITNSKWGEGARFKLLKLSWFMQLQQILSLVWTQWPPMSVVLKLRQESMGSRLQTKIQKIINEVNLFLIKNFSYGHFF